MNARLSYTDRILETIDGLAQVETPVVSRRVSNMGLAGQ